MASRNVGTVLPARNLEFVLGQLAPCGQRIEDVLLYSSLDDNSVSPRVDPAEFRLVHSRVQAVGGAGYFEMAAS